MGILGSKDKLSQIVILYGYNSNDFPWRDTKDKNIYHTTGLIIEYDSKKYVVTIRSNLISCKNIVMYHSYFNDSESILKNNLSILFQSIEYNIIILGTIGKNMLDLSKSKIINEKNLSNFICQSYDICNNNFVIPKKKIEYYTIRMDIDLKPTIINYKTQIYNIFFIESFIFDETFLPKNFMYKFTVDENKIKLNGMCGSIIFNKKHELIGIITRIKNKILYVLPTKMLNKITTDFCKNLSNPTNYTGLLSFSFPYTINSGIIITENYYLNTIAGKFLIKSNDNIISIGGNDIIILDDEVLIKDNDLKKKYHLTFI